MHGRNWFHQSSEVNEGDRTSGVNKKVPSEGITAESTEQPGHSVLKIKIFTIFWIFEFAFYFNIVIFASIKDSRSNKKQ